MTLIRSQIADRIATIAFDHDAKRNALGADLIAEILNALERFKAEGARVVVLRSATSGSLQLI